MVSLDDTPYIKSDVIGRQLEHETVLVLPKQGKVKVVNEVGARIWSLIDGDLAVRDIVQMICREFQVQNKTAESDTIAFLGELMDRGLIELTSDPAPA